MRVPLSSTPHLPRALHSKEQLEQNANLPLGWGRTAEQGGVSLEFQG